MAEPGPQRRDQFLINWYGILWSNVDRSMRGIWNVLGTVTLTGTVLVAVHKEYLPYSPGIVLGFLLIFWAVNITIDLNAWHRRNLFFLTAVERELLSGRDYGTILPRSYQRPKRGWITFYTLNAMVFILLALIFCAYALVRETTGPRPSGVWSVWLIPIHWVALAVGVVITIVNAAAQRRSAKEHWKELFASSGGSEGTPAP